jgi:uncharacterized protein YbjT (DUF2867 family)
VPGVHLTSRGFTVPCIHLHLTVKARSEVFTFLNAASVRERHTLVLPFGEGRTSPIAPTDVARVVATILRQHEDHQHHVYELTGPEILDIDGLAERYSRALRYPVSGVDLPYDEWLEKVLKPVGIPSHIEQHIATMARLHRADRYNRGTNEVEQVTGQPAQTVEQYIADHLERFAG